MPLNNFESHFDWSKSLYAWASFTVSVLSSVTYAPGQMPKESLLVKYNLPQFKRIVDAVKERLNAKTLKR